MADRNSKSQPSINGWLLCFRNFKNIVDGSFALGPPFNVVIGQNGSGKSTLLHAMQVVTGAFFLGLPRRSRLGGHDKPK